MMSDDVVCKKWGQVLNNLCEPLGPFWIVFCNVLHIYLWTNVPLISGEFRCMRWLCKLNHLKDPVPLILAEVVDGEIRLAEILLS